jgi:hypothetical protein
VDVGASRIIVRALASDAVDKSGLITDTVYVPIGIPEGTFAIKVVLEKYEVDNDPYPSKETVEPLAKSFPVMVIVLF